ncbi:M23 family metallopeptidase [Parvibium lacunae]|uniref:M23 family peptidase n=1 Tax=Parvibium lacunae TaxID=1888893 RepID=A0A368L364_9BURK|nr:M23 family metallopeptidase [Parvibium lacunae]RCS57548.1 M23 family peptidase [Parvibium lacunae]
MQIILVHPRLAQARSFTITRKHVLYGLAFSLFMFFGGSSLLAWLAWQTGVMQYIIQPVTNVAGDSQRFVRDNVQEMARRVGELQAQILRLDAVGERVSREAGVKPQEIDFSQPPGRGGQLVVAQEMSLQDLQRSLDSLQRSVESRTDYLSLLEAELLLNRMEKARLPSLPPVAVGYNSSSFGVRIDPITGRQAMHEGVDFVAPVGTPIVAAANGVVIAAEYHHEFGNVIDIDHGEGLISRYAHASRLLVKLNDVVKRGQKIAEVGSTGRSTGSHLHFEVRVNGVPQNPHRFFSATAIAQK